MNEVRFDAFADELDKIQHKVQTLDKERKNRNKALAKKTGIDLAAGAIAGGLSGMAVAPLATVADIAGTNAKSPGDFFYGKKPLAIAKDLYHSGINKRLIKKNVPEELTAILHKTDYMKSDPTLSKLVKTLSDDKRITKELGALERVWHGVKEFYGGQGLKSVKMIPQNAINLATFGIVAGLMHAALTDKK